jgi:hypothetical protein
MLCALQASLQTQSELNEACLKRVVSANDPKTKSAWIGVFVRLCDAVVANAHAIADLEHARGPVSMPERLRLPKLPCLPEEGRHPLPKSAKQPPAE